jgi:hypothetical protein
MTLTRIILLFCFLPFIVFANDPKFPQPQDMPKDFLIGYGSLVNENSRMRSLGRDIVVLPVRISEDFGYRRSWNTRIAGMMTTLGLISAEKGQGNTINGVLYAVKDGDLAVWDNRERSYDRVEVPWQYITSLCWAQLPKQGKAWIYVTKPAFRGIATLAEPVTQSYVDVVMEGFMEFSDDFAKEFIDTTDDWPDYWLNDRLVARRPWEHNPKALSIDQLLRQTLPAQIREKSIDRRRYDSDYFMYSLARPNQEVK